MGTELKFESLLELEVASDIQVGIEGSRVAQDIASARPESNPGHRGKCCRVVVELARPGVAEASHRSIHLVGRLRVIRCVEQGTRCTHGEWRARVGGHDTVHLPSAEDRRGGA